ncbi:unnamed protein product [Hyaloperonospora brassicae]|uniref:Uncharacterized protein n=1 Tax=Hyaloperonospora brassicae TaxID=162125 RepID=A0AAV0TIX0_HYABA|nr:unnamed protein product [Hyaloperonospora brassicae]
MASLAAAAAAAKSLATRRSSVQGHVAMSRETRSPRELLARIGISGKEVVKIIKARGWAIVEPHGLQQQNLYYLPGVLQKAETSGYASRQQRDFFVGEGELYAFILREGGLAFLLPDEVPMRTAPSESKRLADVSKPTTDARKPLGDRSQRKWKRRKKLSTAVGTLADLNPIEPNSRKRSVPFVPVELRKERTGEAAAAEVAVAEVAAAVKEPVDEQQPPPKLRAGPVVQRRAETADTCAAVCGQETEWTEYEQSLKARGWRAQLLQDIDVHLLRSTAAVDRRQRAHERAGGRRTGRAQPTHSVGPHGVDFAEMVQELDALKLSIRASQEDLSSMIEALISEGEQRAIPDRIDPAGRVGIPAFVSTGLGSLVLMRDIERYLLLVVAAVRRHQRAKDAMCASGPTNGLSQPSDRTMKRKDLRALQLTIEESKRELQELAAIVAADLVESCEDHAYDSASEGSASGALQSPHQSAVYSPSRGTSRSMDCGEDLEAGRNGLFDPPNLASPRLEGGKWFV